MAKLTIVKEFKAQRCEICHQSDCYSPDLNTCTRCNTVDITLVNKPVSSNNPYPIQFSYPINQVVIPNTVAIEDLGDTFTIIYRWYSTKRLGLFLAIGLSQMFNVLGQLSSRHGATFWLPLMIIPIYLYFIAAVLLNKTHITITENQILKRNGPISIPFFSNRTIAIDEVSSFEYEKRRNFDSLYLQLTSGKRIKLISNQDDQDTMLFVQKVLRDRLSKKNGR